MGKTKCQHKPCNKEAMYDQGWLEGNRLVHGPVCGTHDKLLGRQNLMRLAGMTLDEAISFDTYARLTRDDAEPIPWELYLQEKRAGTLPALVRARKGKTESE